MSDLAFCVHGHFYQPPREDPLSGTIPIEPGAAPYRNWNERIHDHCYRPNAQLNNFEHISFNIGPTLFRWMETYDFETMDRIVQQDRSNFRRNGVGNAMAQGYNHTILPLARKHDKYTQVRWGIADFEYRFGHKPMGMWLPETAVDDETLEVMADCGIQYTILAPWQAGEEITDFSQPYIVKLPNQKFINVFFYDQDLSTRISFDPGATSNADQFLTNLVMPRINANGDHHNAQHFLLIASDGELYGHHQPFRDKFLSRLLDNSSETKRIVSSYPGLFLKQHPTVVESSVKAFTSWSCMHGVMRWMASCSCTPKGEWKSPLRQAFNELSSRIDEIYVTKVQTFGIDPWLLRDRYIHVIQGEITLSDLLASNTSQKLDENDQIRLGLLLMAQYERQRMFTSCGWFFDDFDRIEPKNNVAYAAQAAWLTYQATGQNLAPHALNWLRPVRSSRTGLRADVVFSQHLRKAQAANYRPEIDSTSIFSSFK